MKTIDKIKARGYKVIFHKIGDRITSVSAEKKGMFFIANNITTLLKSLP